MQALEKEKNDLEVLFPEVEVYGYKLRPWSLKGWAELGPCLSRAVTAFMANPEKSGDFSFSGILELVLDDLSEYVAKSAGISVEEAGKLPGPVVAEMLPVIYEQNEPVLKNLFGRTGVAKFMVRPKKA